MDHIIKENFTADKDTEKEFSPKKTPSTDIKACGRMTCAMVKACNQIKKWVFSKVSGLKIDLKVMAPGLAKNLTTFYPKT